MVVGRWGGLCVRFGLYQVCEDGKGDNNVDVHRDLWIGRWVVKRRSNDGVRSLGWSWMYDLACFRYVRTAKGR